MKYNKAITSLCVCMLSFFFVANSSVVQAVQNTTAKVKLEANDGVDDKAKKKMIKPGTLDELITMRDGQGEQSAPGVIRFSSIPNLTFGSTSGNKVNATGLELPAQLYLVNGKKVGTEYEVMAIPPFVQVIDQRGDDVGFSVSLSSSEFVKRNASGTVEHTLTGAKIRIYGQSLFNNTDKNPANQTNKFRGIVKDPGIGAGTHIAELSKDKNIEIMNTKHGSESYKGVSVSSLVFDKDYTPDKYGFDTPGSSFPKQGETTDQVTLFIPVSAGMQPGEYEATLTWSLNFTP